MAALNSPWLSIRLLILLTFLRLTFPAASTPTPTPTPWPHQFHSLLFVNFSGSLSQIDLWYDWPNGRNFNIIRDQLAGADSIVYDLEWNNGTVFAYNGSSCRTSQVDVGILRPDWLVDGSNYLGQRHVDGYLCNVWEKVEFIWYYEDVLTKRPVHWVFYTGRSIHVMTFEVGAVLEDERWQAPVYCFDKKAGNNDTKSGSVLDLDIRERRWMTS
ncbi:OLC1v1028512C1 [Oldenlandia corymbosa var. corymbosa]|uniref:OLC1v1028512C1 n=1 Tax=Oldenlandia corymbosa var. corymbosa TaxID=529605 RepID=A0AAV1CCF4_OLDCO|nr:OLC1v1028512C1 [Oldenlandia corymbosa var. corymbosa]